MDRCQICGVCRRVQINLQILQTVSVVLISCAISGLSDGDIDSQLTAIDTEFLENVVDDTDNIRDAAIERYHQFYK